MSELLKENLMLLWRVHGDMLYYYIALIIFYLWIRAENHTQLCNTNFHVNKRIVLFISEKEY